MIDRNSVLKFNVNLRLKTNLLLCSGFSSELFADSTIEKTSDGCLHINGYVWASLLRRCLARIRSGDTLAATIGKYHHI